MRQEIRKGKRQRARKGLWLGALPFGYCYGLCSKCTDPNGQDYCPNFGSPDRSAGKMIIAHPIESQVVKLVFDWYKTGEYSTASIADKLNEYELRMSDECLVRPRSKGAPGRTEAGPFKRDVIRDMLRRMAYTGILPYQGMDSDGKHPKRKQANEVFQGTHPALIDEATFQQVEQVRQALSFNARHKNGSEVRVYPLTGILKCGFCGNNLRGSSNAYHRYYVDSSMVDRGQDCQQATIRSDRIEHSIYTFLLRVIDDDETFVSLEALQSQLEDAEARFERAKELYLTGMINHETYEIERYRLENVKPGL